MKKNFVLIWLSSLFIFIGVSEINTLIYTFLNEIVSIYSHDFNKSNYNSTLFDKLINYTNSDISQKNILIWTSILGGIVVNFIGEKM
jgi:hypothetical protein